MSNVPYLKKEILYLREIAELKAYVSWLEDQLEEKYNGNDCITWSTVTGLMFEDAYYTANVDPDAMADFNFRKEGFD